VLLRALLITAAASTVPVTARGLELMLGPRAITAAIDLGQSRLDAVRARFHRPYRQAVARPPVDYVEVVTPFRRVVLAAETRARSGDRSYSQREGFATLQSGPAQVDLVVELTVHPHNTYVGVPDVGVRLAASTGARQVIEPVALQRLPRFVPRVAGVPLTYPFPAIAPAAPGSQPLTGGTVIASFDGTALRDRDLYEVVVEEEGKERARVRVNVRELR
jgi:hypothetical protein